MGVRSIKDNTDELTVALYLQVSIISQALISVTRSRSWSFVEQRPDLLLVFAFIAAQLGIGRGWAGVIWLYSLITYFHLDVLKFIIRYALSGRAWDNFLQNKTAFTSKRRITGSVRERHSGRRLSAPCTAYSRPPHTTSLFDDNSNYRELSEIRDCKVKQHTPLYHYMLEFYTSREERCLFD
ncbi:hypothetical protein B296_00001302 [Ensete ventricosum]|uniref:Uncharacterized protein n=1 Tax=Ensete ventricosum TaxID=4639 RepID=A0A427AJJ0_ENSVE|nr:hypothetical protein B296_00001302 [Ensete ventricosum]